MQGRSQNLSEPADARSGRARVRAAVHREQVATAARLAAVTGLSVVTVNKLLRELVSGGEVLAEAPAARGCGRPAMTYRFNGGYELILIITCYRRHGNDYAGYSVHDLFGECLERREELLSRLDSVHTDEFVIGIEDYLGRYPKIDMIGISMPADSVGGRVGAAIRHDPQSKRLARHLEQRFAVPVFFETDINAAALGCYRRTGAEYICGVVLVPGKVPACGFCYAGAVLRGQAGMAGEVRYFPMYNDRGVLPTEALQADDLAIRTLRAVMCVLNPGLVVVYTETLTPGLGERLHRSLPTAAEEALLPKLEISSHLREDVVSGMIILSLECLDAAKKNR